MYNPDWLDSIIKYSVPNKFNIALLNVNSLLGSHKLYSIDSILKTNAIDLLAVLESKLGDEDPDSLFEFSNYRIIRRDRQKGSGGIAIFLKKGITIEKELKDPDYELITLKLRINIKCCNIVIAYNPHLEYYRNFNENLESCLKSLKTNTPTIVMGDLNQDLLTDKGKHLQCLMDDYGFDIKYNQATHYQRNAATLIDVVFCNDSDFLIKSNPLMNDFSNHSIILSTCDIKPSVKPASKIMGRVLNRTSLDEIKSYIDDLNSDFVYIFDDINDCWASLKLQILNIVDSIAPLKKFRLRKGDNLPWIDNECLHWLLKRNQHHKKAVNSGTNRENEEWSTFKETRKTCKYLLRKKKNLFFADMKSDFFNSPKNFWKFYGKYIKMKKDKSNKINLINLPDGRVINSSAEIAHEFNSFISDFSLPKQVSIEESNSYIDDTFKTLKNNGKISPKSFCFDNTTPTEISDLIKLIDNSSSPGISGIPVKVIKHCSEGFSRILCKFFNNALKLESIPKEWKYAITSPLYKGKGDNSLFDNYRGISVLTPIGKIFEKIICRQVISYFEENQLLTSDQHGFRTNHSCETAVASMIDQWKMGFDQKKFTVSLFVDFRKAFDLIDPKLLFRKLFHYGFTNPALNLLMDYFKNRIQVCKIAESTSEAIALDIGFPQGSVCAALLFLIFINDAALMSELDTFLFADDTTMYSSGTNLAEVISNTKRKLEPFLEWVHFNEMSINWKKTKFMILSKCKFLEHPKFITIADKAVDVVSTFKLLGINIDHTLSFNDHVRKIKAQINKKIFVLMKLSYLSQSVKMNFFKSFILPHFDYCSSLVVFMKKKQIASLEKYFNLCLHRLFNFNLFHLNINTQFDFLKKYNILPLRLRLFVRLNNFVYKCVNNLYKTNLFGNIIFNYHTRPRASSYQEIAKVPKTISNTGKGTLSYFTPKFLNCVMRNAYNFNFKDFKSSLKSNLFFYYHTFINNFDIFCG